MMRATEGHCELIAHFAAERTRLREAQMVGIGRPATADQARLLNQRGAVRRRQAHSCLSELPRWFAGPS
jgi:hypothetical protein